MNPFVLGVELSRDAPRLLTRAAQFARLLHAVSLGARQSEYGFSQYFVGIDDSLWFEAESSSGTRRCGNTDAFLTKAACREANHGYQ
jgi:hypothetical protein